MSKVFKGIGKIFKKALPVIFPIALGAAAISVMGPAGLGLWGGAGSAGGGGLFKSIFGGLGGLFGGGPGGEMGAQGGDMLRSGVLSRGGLESAKTALGAKNLLPGAGPAGSGGLFGWIENNPMSSLLAGGLISGAAQGYFLDQQLDEQKRQFDVGRTWPGAFYGMTREGQTAGPGAGLIASRQRAT
jgi:hypothetical protein